MSDCTLPDGAGLDVGFSAGPCTLPDGAGLDVGFGESGAVMRRIGATVQAPAALRLGVSCDLEAPAKLAGPVAPSMIVADAAVRARISQTLAAQASVRQRLSTRVEAPASLRLGVSARLTAPSTAWVGANLQAPAVLKRQWVSQRLICETIPLSHSSAVLRAPADSRPWVSARLVASCGAAARVSSRLRSSADLRAYIPQLLRAPSRPATWARTRLAMPSAPLSWVASECVAPSAPLPWVSARLAAPVAPLPIIMARLRARAALRRRVPARLTAPSAGLSRVSGALRCSAGSLSRVASRLSAPVGLLDPVSSGFAAPAWLPWRVASRLRAPADLESIPRVSARLNAPADLTETTPQLHPVRVSVTHQGRPLGVVDQITLAIDEGGAYWTAAIQLAEAHDYAAIALGDSIEIRLDDTDWSFIVDVRRFSRVFPPQYALDLVSPCAALAAPTATPVTIPSAGMAHAVCEQLLGESIDWQLPDWRLPAEATSMEDTPLALARKIAAAAGGTLESEPDGTLRARLIYPAAVPDYAGPSLIPLTDRDVLEHSASAGSAELYNRFIVSSGESAASAVQVEREQDPDDPHAYTVRAYPVPWRDLTLLHTGDAATHIEAKIEARPAHSELLEVVDHRTTAQYPVAEVILVGYQHADLGGIAVGEDGSSITTDGDYSLLRLDYLTHAWTWRVTNARDELIQFLVEDTA